MSLEVPLERRNPLLAPGRDDLSLWPPIGQMPFDRITAMSEEQLDAEFKLRHGLDEIFNVTDGHVKPYQKDSQSGRRVEIKRIVLARLEGYPFDQNSELYDWTGPVKGGSGDHGAVIKSKLVGILTPACKERMASVRKNVARDAAIQAPPEEVRLIMKKINSKLKSLQLEELSVHDIFLPDHLPRHSEITSGEGGELNIYKLLKVFLLITQGHSNAECAARFSANQDSLTVRMSTYFSPKAKEVISIIRRGKK